MVHQRLRGGTRHPIYALMGHAAHHQMTTIIRAIVPPNTPGTINLMCDCGGEMVWTYRDTSMFPNSFPHQCRKCGIVENLYEIYPKAVRCERACYQHQG